jgi:hypothetical protein
MRETPSTSRPNNPVHTVRILLAHPPQGDNMRTRSIWTRPAAVTTAALILIAALAGCNLFGPPAVYETTTVSVFVDSGPSTSMAPGASGPSFVIAGTTSPDEIDSISLSVSGDNKFGVFQDPLATAAMSGSGASWSATVDDLPLGPPLTFSIQAFDAGGTLIYTGTTTTVLSAGNLAVAIVLVPYDDGATQIFFPVIRQITRPAEIVEGTNAQIAVDLEGSSTETLTVDIVSGGGGFASANPIGVPLSSGAATLDLTYSAPSGAPDTYVHTVRAENEQGNSVSRDFSTVVVWAADSAEVTIGGVAPAVTGFSLALDAGSLILEATVTDDGPLGDISYAWSYDGGLLFTDATTNPAALAGYTEAATGTVTLTVTDSDTSIQAGGLSTTITFVLPAGLFPDVVETEPAGGGVGTGSFTYFGGTLPLHGGELENDGSGGTVDQFHTWTIILHSDSLTFDSGTAEYSGVGDVVWVTVITNSLTDLDVGVYTYDPTSPSSQTSAMVFDTGDIYVDYDTSDESYALNLDVDGGTLAVTSSGPDYSVSFNFTTASGAVTGSYVGTLVGFND